MSSPASIDARARMLVWLTVLVGVAGIGAFDYSTGVELRVFPLYYAPISLAAWQLGRSGGLLSAALSSAFWLGSNHLAGLHLSHPGLLFANTLVQAVSFATVGYLIATLRDALARERGLSRTDPLTSLMNTRAFYEGADRVLALCRRKGHPVTLAYVDLDGFKAVNDHLGHPAGDAVLQRVAALLRASTRPSDLCARLGGDEFVVLLPEVGAQDAAVALERLRKTLSETVVSGGAPVTSSIGAVTFTTMPDTLDDMVRAADASMYAAKAAGKNRLRLEVAGGNDA
jgi:diguanylate cyclase (GGDEF)-like protein